MKVSQRLYEKALPIWESYFTHPFIQGMADGTLAKDKFQFYMIQDHKYLMEYAKVFALGVIKSRDEKDMRLFAAFIADTLNTENAVHQFFLKELGITQEDIERTPMCLNNDSYTNYMIAVAMKEGLAELTTALLRQVVKYLCKRRLPGRQPDGDRSSGPADRRVHRGADPEPGAYPDQLQQI